MAKKFDKDVALQVVKKRELTQSEVDETDVNPLYKEYFSIETGMPIDFNQITKRIKRRFSEVNKLSIHIIMDLFFVYNHWTSFYKRGDSFSKYLTQELEISRTYGYGLINAVSLMQKYINQIDREIKVEDFIKEISAVIDQIGITKIISISTLKDEEQQYQLLDRLLKGEEVNITAIKEEKRKTDNLKTQLIDNKLLFRDTPILEFSTINGIVITAVRKSVDAALNKKGVVDGL